MCVCPVHCNPAEEEQVCINMGASLVFLSYMNTSSSAWIVCVCLLFVCLFVCCRRYMMCVSWVFIRGGGCVAVASLDCHGACNPRVTPDGIPVHSGCDGVCSSYYQHLVTMNARAIPHLPPPLPCVVVQVVCWNATKPSCGCCCCFCC